MSENQKGLPKLCKLCEEPLPKVALAFSNRIAIEEGYCCWMWLLWLHGVRIMGFFSFSACEKGQLTILKG